MNSPANTPNPSYHNTELNTINIIVLNIIETDDLLKSGLTWI